MFHLPICNAGLLSFSLSNFAPFSLFAPEGGGKGPDQGIILSLTLSLQSYMSNPSKYAPENRNLAF